MIRPVGINSSGCSIRIDTNDPSEADPIGIFFGDNIVSLEHEKKLLY